MTKRLEKKTKNLLTIIGHEIETKLFIHHVLKLFPDISVVEMRRFIAKYLHILVGYQWVMYSMSDIKAKGFFLKECGESLSDKHVVKINNIVENGVSKINEESRLAVKAIVEDSQSLAKNIKGKMMEEIDVRLEADTESFSNDELIRGSKAMHEIETNASDTPNININVLELVGGIEKFNETLNELKQKQSAIDGDAEKIAPNNGEIQKR